MDDDVYWLCVLTDHAYNWSIKISFFGLLDFFWASLTTGVFTSRLKSSLSIFSSSLRCFFPSSPFSLSYWGGRNSRKRLIDAQLWRLEAERDPRVIRILPFFLPRSLCFFSSFQLYERCSHMRVQQVHTKYKKVEKEEGEISSCRGELCVIPKKSRHALPRRAFFSKVNDLQNKFLSRFIRYFFHIILSIHAARLLYKMYLFFGMAWQPREKLSRFFFDI